MEEFVDRDSPLSGKTSRISTLFWRDKTAGFSLPEKVHIHGFLTVDGQKMSKSRGTFVQASTYLKHLDPAYLRYYYASKLGARLDDLDLNLEEFVNKVNSDLVGKVVNLASRTARFVENVGLSDVYPDDGGLFVEAAAQADAIAAAYEACDYNAAMRTIMALADRANQYVEQTAPWTLRKDANRARNCKPSVQSRSICSRSSSICRRCCGSFAASRRSISTAITDWNQSQTPLAGTRVSN